MRIIDVNCLYGHWPFRHVPGESIAETTTAAASHGIDVMLLSSLNAIFYRDCYEGDEELHNVLPQNAYHIMTIDPSVPTFEDDLKCGLSQFRLKGVKIFPTYHNFDLKDSSVTRLIDILTEMDIPLMLAMQIEDPRLCHMCFPSSVPVHSVESMVQNNKKIPIVLLNCINPMLNELSNIAAQYGNLYFDTSGLRYDLETINKMVKKWSSERILYGSQAPLYCRKSTLNLVFKDNVPEDIQHRILYKNAEELFSI